MSDNQALNDFFAAWSETDADRRAEIIRSAAGSSFSYADPHADEAIGTVDDFLGYVANFSKNMPGASAAVIEPVDLHHGHARANVRWDFGGGKTMVGQYFADLDSEGRITRIIGFPGKGAE